MKKLIALCLLLHIFSSSIIAQTNKDKKTLKKEAALNDYESLKKLLNAGSIEFIGDWATTISGRRINLFSNPNSLRIDQEEADIFLPFFGTSQKGGYGSASAIEFKGKLINYKLSYHDKKQKATIKFSVTNDDLERFDFSLQVFGSGNTTISVNSSYRSHIRYNGKTKALIKKEDKN